MKNYYYLSSNTGTEMDISRKDKQSKKNFKMFLSLSFHNYKVNLKSESTILFKPNKLMVDIGKKPAPGNHESSLTILFARDNLPLCPIL